MRLYDDQTLSNLGLHAIQATEQLAAVTPVKPASCVMVRRHVAVSTPKPQGPAWRSLDFSGALPWEKRQDMKGGREVGEERRGEREREIKN